MKLTLIVPVHNEEATVQEVLKRVVGVDLGNWQREIIVVNDGSSDGTKNILQAICSGPDGYRDITLLHHEKNLGKGAAMRSGFKKATGDYILVQDADLEYYPEDIPKLLSLVEANTLKEVVVFGKRGYHVYPERGLHYALGAMLLTGFYNVLYAQRITDLYTCYKLFPASVLRKSELKSSGFEIEAETACKFARLGVKIMETQIRYKPRSRKQGKHISLVDAFKGLWAIIKYRVRV